MGSPIEDEIKNEFRPARLQCLDNGHRFSQKVWKKVHYGAGLPWLTDVLAAAEQQEQGRE
jgi:hypothetical protein